MLCIFKVSLSNISRNFYDKYFMYGNKRGTLFPYKAMTPLKYRINFLGRTILTSEDFPAKTSVYCQSRVTPASTFALIIRPMTPSRTATHIQEFWFACYGSAFAWIPLQLAYACMSSLESCAPSTHAALYFTDAITVDSEQSSTDLT